MSAKQENKTLEESLENWMLLFMWNLKIWSLILTCFWWKTYGVSLVMTNILENCFLFSTDSWKAPFRKFQDSQESLGFTVSKTLLVTRKSLRDLTGLDNGKAVLQQDLF